MRTASLVAPRLRPLSLSWRQWALVLASLVALLALFDLVAPSNPIRVWYWMRFVAPTQELRYGFTAQLAADHQCLEVTSVKQGGAFANAGIQPGFVPVERSCLGFSTVELFFLNLRDRTGMLKLEFVTGGCASRTQERPAVFIVSVPAAGAAG
jgi:hypothetical protein